jgi:hypothetical protein
MDELIPIARPGSEDLSLKCPVCSGRRFRFRSIGDSTPGHQFELIRRPGIGVCWIENSPVSQAVPLLEEQAVVCVTCEGEARRTPPSRRRPPEVAYDHIGRRIP